MNDSIRQTFDRAAPGYDAQRRLLIPRFDDFYGTVLELLDDRFATRSFRCLDLGVGTGLLAEMILDRFPKSEVTGLDIAEKMLETATERLERFGERAKLAVADYAETPLPGPVEAIVSALSIHHLSHDQKQKLFAKIHQTLEPGGVFINADQALGPSPSAETAYQNRWLTDIDSNGISTYERQGAIARTSMDRSAGMVEQIFWLKQAGFAAADIAWKRYRFTVFVAWKG